MTTLVWVLIIVVAMALVGWLCYRAATPEDEKAAAGVWERFERRVLALTIPVLCLAAAGAAIVALILVASGSGWSDQLWGQLIAGATLLIATLLLFGTGPRRYTVVATIDQQPGSDGNPGAGPYAPDTILVKREYQDLPTEAKKRVRVQRGLFFQALYVGLDGRWSTSKLQVLLWTYVIAYAVLTLFIADQLGLDLIDPRDPEPGADADTSTPAAQDGARADGYEFGDLEFREEYLLLLGGPFAAAIAAKAITQSKVESGDVDKTPPESPESQEADTSEGPQGIISDDDGRTDIVDLQYFLFNLIALAVFLVLFVPAVERGLPEIPTFLVALTSGSALTYLGKKAVERSAPSIATVVPTRVAAGGAVTVSGQHLLGSAGGVPDVTVAGLAADRLEILRRPRRTTDAAQIRFKVPFGVSPGADVEVRVAAAGSSTATSTTIEVLGPPKITAVAPDPLTLAAGTTVIVAGSGFGPPSEAATVSFVAVGEVDKRTVPLHNQDWRDDRVVATIGGVPALPPGDTPQLTLRLSRAEPEAVGSYPVGVAKPAITVANATPLPIPLTVGTRVIITGTGFGTMDPNPQVMLQDATLRVVESRLDTIMVCELGSDVANLAQRTDDEAAATLQVARDGWATASFPVTVKAPQ